jgi:hypothetical protein
VKKEIVRQASWTQTDLDTAVPADAACPVSEWPAKISAAAGGAAATPAPAPAAPARN